MSVVVKTITRLVKSFIFLFGLYIVSYGHLSPGGGFSGGVILTCAFVLVMLAFGRDHALRRFGLHTAEQYDSIGALGFLATAVVGFFSMGVFFANWLSVPAVSWLNAICTKCHVGPFRLLSAGTIPVNNLFIALKVCASLFLVYALLAMLRFDNAKTED